MLGKNIVVLVMAALGYGAYKTYRHNIGTPMNGNATATDATKSDTSARPNTY